MNGAIQQTDSPCVGHNLLTEKLECCATIGVPAIALAPESDHPFRDEAALSFAVKLVASLRASGYKTSDARPGKACHAAFKCYRADTPVTVIINRQGQDFHLTTWISRAIPDRLRRLLGKHSRVEDWAAALSDIDCELKGLPEIKSVQWHTFREAMQRWK